MKRIMFFIRFLMISLATFLCALSASAYEGAGFTIDIPADWTEVIEADGVYHWLSPEEDVELVVAVSDNEDQRNPFDLREEETEEALSQLNVAAEYARNMEEGFRQQGIFCTVEEEATTFSLREWGDGQPALVMESQYRVYLTEAEIETPYDLYMVILTAKEHSFVVSCASTDKAALEAVMAAGTVDTFRMTEAVYDGPTDMGAALGDVIFSAGITMLFVVLLLGGVKELRRKRKKTTVDVTDRL